MAGRKVFSNEHRLSVIAWVGSAVWTCCCVLLVLYGFREIDAEKEHPSFETLIKGGRSKSEVFWLGVIVWGGGGAGIGGGYWLFRKVNYRIDYDGCVITVKYSWPRKQLFVDDELQDENGDFAFAQVVLRGRIKSGQAAGKPIRVSCAFDTYSPICVNIDDRVVFRG